jgi:hypothetical protein
MLYCTHAQDFYIDKPIIRNATHKLHNVRYNSSTIKPICAYLGTTNVCSAIDCTSTLWYRICLISNPPAGFTHSFNTLVMLPAKLHYDSMHGTARHGTAR